MIFYFSGTGNSRRIALRLAGLTADKAVDIVSLTDIPDPKTERRIGLVFPVYAWGCPNRWRAFSNGCRQPIVTPLPRSPAAPMRVMRLKKPEKSGRCRPPGVWPCRTIT